MNRKTRMMTFNALLMGLMFIMTFTPIGYITVGAIQITLMCLPVIIGTLVLGLKSGVFLGFIFGVTSLITAIITPVGLTGFLFAHWPYLTIIPIFIPRLLIPVVTHFVYRAISGGREKRQVLSMSTAAIAGSLTNTVLFIGLLIVMFTQPLTEFLGSSPQGVFVLLSTVAVTNGLPEAAAAAI
ncbi:MAG: ECF transporter S component, partial [Christensenellales bacterium]